MNRQSRPRSGTEHLQSTLDKALTLLTYMAATGEPMSITEISGFLGISRGTAYSIVRTMTVHEYLAQKENRKYFLSCQCFSNGQAFRMQYADLLPCSSVITRFLMNDPPAWLKVCSLFVLQPGGVLFAFIENFPHARFDYTAIAAMRSRRFTPWYANAAGYLLAAFASPALQRQCFAALDAAPDGQFSLPARNLVEGCLEQARHDFFYADTSDLFMLNEATVAAPVFLRSGTPAASLCFTVHADAFRLREREISDSLRSLTRQLSISLGCHPLQGGLPHPYHL